MFQTLSILVLFIHRSSETSSKVSTSVVGTPQDELGIPVSLLGQLASVAFFDEALLPEKVAQLYHMGETFLNIWNFAPSYETNNYLSLLL